MIPGCKRRQFYTLQNVLLGAFCLLLPLWYVRSFVCFAPIWALATRTLHAFHLNGAHPSLSTHFSGFRSREVLPGAEHLCSPASVSEFPKNLVENCTSYWNPVFPRRDAWIMGKLSSCLGKRCVMWPAPGSRRIPSFTETAWGQVGGTCALSAFGCLGPTRLGLVSDSRGRVFFLTFISSAC